jgi:hypothetical protein
MLNLNAYTPANLQAFSGLLALASASKPGCTVAELQQQIVAACPQIIPSPSPPQEIQANICPSCGAVAFIRGKDIEGLKRMGCLRCRYSTLVGVAE